MKKIILTAAALAVFNSTTVLATADTFYLKGNVGWSKLSNFKSLKSNNHGFLTLGAGYGLMDNIRADLTYEHHFNPTHKGTRNGNSVKVKENIDVLLLNGFVDVVDVSMVNIFAGAGVGLSMLKHKWTNTTLGTSGSVKAKTNFAYALHLGAGAEVAPGVNAELTYSWKDFGRSGKISNKDTHLKWADKNDYRGSNVSAGVRFDI